MLHAKVNAVALLRFVNEEIFQRIVAVGWGKRFFAELAVNPTCRMLRLRPHANELISRCALRTKEIDGFGHERLPQSWSPRHMSARRQWQRRFTADLGHSPLPMPSPPERRCFIFAPRLRVVCPTPDSWRAKFESSVLRGIFMDNLQAAIAMPPTSAMNARRFTQSPRRRWRVTPVVGFLSSFSAGDRPHHTEAFRQGLNETGYGEGRNLAIEYPFADNRLEQLEPLAADLIACNVAVIAAVGGNNSAVKAGLVSSFNRPGANVTGVSWFSAELGSKHLEVLNELVPQATLIALLVNRNIRKQHSTSSRRKRVPARSDGGCSSSKPARRRKSTPRLRSSQSSAPTP